MSLLPSRALASAIVIAASLSALDVASAQTCTWGGTPSAPLPAATFLRSQRDFLRAPARIAVDGSGNVYTTDAGSGRVTVRDPYGRLASLKTGLLSPTAVAVDRFGGIYVAEAGTGSVSVFDPQWSLRYKLGVGDGEFTLPNDITIDPDPRFGWIYVSDGDAHAIRVYSADGAFLSSFGGKGTGSGQLDFPAAVYASAAGEILVADQNNDRVQVFDRNGAFLRCFGRRGSTSFTRRFGRIQGITRDSQGRIYVADAFQGYIQVFDTQGVALGTIGNFGEGAGQLQTPMGVAIDPSNRLFVSSVNSGRVEVFGLDSYTDTHLEPAAVDVLPASLMRSVRYRYVEVSIELRNRRPNRVNLSTVTANGVPALKRASIGDRDADGIRDLTVRFRADPLLATLEDGGALVVVRGTLRDGTPFEGYDTVRVDPSEGAGP